MSYMDSATTVTQEQLEEAAKNYAKALELRDSQPETAIELLGKVLETRNKAFGEKAMECADIYLCYGELLFEQAQANTDYFGDQMKSAAMQRARHIAAGEDGAAADSGDDLAEDGDDEEDQDMGAAADIGTAQPTDATASEPAETKPDTTSNVEQMKEAAADVTTDKPAQLTADDKPAEATLEVAMAEVQKDKQQLADGDHEESNDDGSDEGESLESEKMAEGQEPAEAPEVTGETDDMALAWEMLEMARLIYNENGGADKFANKLADCHMYIADILCEQEKFEEAVPEYNTARELLNKLEGGLQAHRRRAAELDFKKATALQLSEQLPEALESIRCAKTHLQARLDEVNVELGKAGAAGSSGAAAAAAGDASGAAAFAAFAAVLTGYSKPVDGIDNKEVSNDGSAAALSPEEAEKAAAVARKQQEAADLRSLIESINDRIDELNAAVEEHISMKEQLCETFAMVAAEKGTGNEETEAAREDASSVGAVESSAFAAPTMQTGAVKDMGVIGKGKRVAPVPLVEKSEKSEAGKKRTRSDLVSSDQENSNEAVDVGVLGKPAPGVAAEQPDAVPKKARADA